MKPELESSLGIAMNQEVERVLSQLMNMSDALESDFSQLRCHLHSMENNMIKAINEQKDAEIKAKDL